MAESFLLYLVPCPGCKREHPLFLYPYEGVIVCCCGVTIGDIEIGQTTHFSWVGPKSRLFQEKYWNKHSRDDRVLGYDDDAPF